MTLHDLLALALFAFVTSITPGPNNLMLLSSGATFGIRRSLPHMLGVALGFGAMIFALGAGLAELYRAVPWLNTALKLLGTVYLLWLAWKIARAQPAGTTAERRGRPFRFIEAAGFQWVNPKAWTMALSALALYASDGGFVAVAIVAALFTAVNLPSIAVWTLLGTAIARLLQDPVILRRVNIALALLLVLSVLPMLRL